LSAYIVGVISLVRNSPGLAEDFCRSIHLDRIGRSGQDGSQSHQNDAEYKTFIAAPYVDELHMSVSEKDRCLLAIFQLLTLASGSLNKPATS
jgi:hypothetical protein